MQQLTNYSYGKDCFQELPEILRNYDVRKVVLVGGEKALASAEDEIRQVLDGQGITITASLVYGKAATQATIDRLLTFPQVHEADIVIGIGGGQALDTAKMVAKESHKAIITIPTICSTCAASTGLAIIYNDDHSLAYYGRPSVPVHTFLNTRIMAEAPDHYFWAGIGDGISKGPEVTKAMAEDMATGNPEYHSAVLGRAIAQSSLYSLYQNAAAALRAVTENKVTQAVEEVVLAIIISTGYASNLVNQSQFDYTACHAHAFYNGTTIVKREGEYLHGAIVAFGVMVLHAYFEEQEALETVLAFNQALGLPTSLSDIGLTEEDIPAIVDFSTKTNEYRHTPYDTEKFARAISYANQLGQQNHK